MSKELQDEFISYCSCGEQPYMDRIALGKPLYWFACNCGEVSNSKPTVKEAVEFWNARPENTRKRKVYNYDKIDI